MLLLVIKWRLVTFVPVALLGIPIDPFTFNTVREAAFAGATAGETLKSCRDDRLMVGISIITMVKCSLLTASFTEFYYGFDLVRTVIVNCECIMHHGRSSSAADATNE